DLAEDFAADALGPGFAVGHHALRRGQDGDAETVADARHLLGGDVGSLARARHAAHAGDRAARTGAAVVAQGQLEHALLVVIDGGDALDEALVAQDLGEPELDGRARALDQLLAGADAVADTGEEVSDGIGHRHGWVLSPARLDDARDVAAQGELAEAKAAHLELAEIRARPAAALAAALDADLELELLGKLVDQLAHGFLSGRSSGARGCRGGDGPERHAE